MKRIVCAIIMVTLVMAISGCNNNSSGKSAVNAGSNTVQNVIDQQIGGSSTEASGSDTERAENPETEAKTEAETERTEASQTSSFEYDVDLTALSSTMVYSEVYNMMVTPEDYIGKTVKMNGQFALYQGYGEDEQPDPDAIYYACIIADATACCSQGLEFVLEGDYTYPDDYPELGSEIAVAGTFETYEEAGYTYCHLVDAAIL